MKKALVLSLAFVLGLGAVSFAQTLSGSWDTLITITPQPLPTPVTLEIDSTLIVTYAVSGWTFSSKSVLDETGWKDQVFTAGGALGAFTLGSTLDFAPATAAFEKWDVTGGMSLAGVSFTGKFTLLPNDVSLVLTGIGTAGNVNVTIKLTLGALGTGCDLDFNAVQVKVDFPFCCANVYSTIDFTCAGFTSATFGVKGIAIPNLPWVSINALLTFTPGAQGGKALDLDAVFDWGAIACFKLYISQTQTTGTGPAGVLTLGDISVDGIGLFCEIGGVSFSGVSYWGTGTKPSLLKDTVYWEAYQIKTTDKGCCGPFAFDVTVYFLNGGIQLFDVAKIAANMSIQVATQFTFKTGIEIDLTMSPTFTKWTVGFLVKW